MTERTSFHDGEPCWADALVHDLSSAQRFYQAVLGWTFRSGGPDLGGYTLCFSGDAAVAGLMPPEPGSDTSMPATWNLYLASADVDATARTVDEAGGRTVAGPMEIPGSGRMAYALDPTGAPVGAWQAGGHLGFSRVSEPGAYAWAELNTRDPQAAGAFYERLFGYRRRQIGDGHDFDYEVWSLDDQDVCGRLAMTAEWGEIPPNWMVYYAVADADAACEQATATGGAVRQPPFDTSYGRVCVLADPDGAVFSVVDLSRAEAPDAA